MLERCAYNFMTKLGKKIHISRKKKTGREFTQMLWYVNVAISDWELMGDFYLLPLPFLYRPCFLPTFNGKYKTKKSYSLMNTPIIFTWNPYVLIANLFHMFILSVSLSLPFFPSLSPSTHFSIYPFIHTSIHCTSFFPKILWYIMYHIYIIYTYIHSFLLDHF